MSKSRTAIMIDGGHLRVLAKMAKISYNPNYIEKAAHACVSADEELLRILYYDCAPYIGTVKLPISGGEHKFAKSADWLVDLAKKDLFAVRRGVLKFRGWVPRKIPVASMPVTDSDFKPEFEQKGVDMRIGLDVATYSSGRLVDRLILISADTDCIPAMKQARKQGVQIILATFPKARISGDLLCHSDFYRKISWPDA